jgi:caffeoyl-CoA O-methyltransferase
MFHDIPGPMLARMRDLEDIDARDRREGTPQAKRMRQIPPETGRFLALLLASAPPGGVLEVGTSAGYSSLWLSLACRERGDTLTTFEVHPNKIELAHQTFHMAGVENLVQLVEGDARQHLAAYTRTAFCFMDAEKDLYQACYDLVIPNMVPGGIFAADNATSHPELRPFLDLVLADSCVDAMVVPVGKGVLVCRKI